MAKHNIDAILRQSYRLRKAGITNEMIATRSTFSLSAVGLWRIGKLSKTGRAWPVIEAAAAVLLAEAELAKVDNAQATVTASREAEHEPHL